MPLRTLMLLARAIKKGFSAPVDLFFAQTAYLALRDPARPMILTRSSTWRVEMPWILTS